VVGYVCDFIDNGYEVEFGPVFDAEAVRVVCKLIENIAKRLIRKGFLSYRCDRKSRSPLPNTTCVSLLRMNCRFFSPL
jgi:hypothetical protein